MGTSLERKNLLPATETTLKIEISLFSSPDMILHKKQIQYEMITSVRFCLSYGLLNAILSHSFYFNENLHCRHGSGHDATCSPRKCYVTCGHNIIYDMTLSTE